VRADVTVATATDIERRGGGGAGGGQGTGDGASSGKQQASRARRTVSNSDEIFVASRGRNETRSWPSDGRQTDAVIGDKRRVAGFRPHGSLAKNTIVLSCA